MGLQLKIDVKNNASKELIRLQKDLKQLNISIPKTSNNFSMLSKSMVGLVASTYAVSKAYDMTIKRGLEYNNLLENQRNSIATLISVTSQNIDSQGKALNYQDKMNLSLKNSNELMTELTKINANTPQTLGQTAQIFKTMYAPMQKVGASQKDLIFLTEKLAIASKVGGVEFNSLLAGVDGLASGTVLANSDLGRFLSSLGLTNEALKESGDVIGLLKDKLKDFKAFDDLDTAVSNLNVQWDTLTGNMTKDIFSGQKQSVKELTGLIQALNKDAQLMDTFRENANALAKGTVNLAVGTVQFINGLRLTFVDIEFGIKNALNFVSLGFDAMKIEYLELSKSFQDTMNEGFKALGVDTRINLVDIFAIDELNDKMINTKLLIGDNIKEWNKQENTIHNQTQAFLDAETIILKNLEHHKEITKELDKQGKNNGKLLSKITYSIDKKDIEAFKKLEKEREKALKNNSIDIGSSVSTAIIDGINGSGLEDMLKNLSTSVGSSMINAGVGKIGASFDPMTSLALGVGLTAVGGLFGGGGSSAPIPKDYTSIINSANYATNTGVSIVDYDGNFDKFIEGLDRASERLENFGSVGSADSSEITALTNEILRYENVREKNLYSFSQDSYSGRNDDWQKTSYTGTFEGETTSLTISNPTNAQGSYAKSVIISRLDSVVSGKINTVKAELGKVLTDMVAESLNYDSMNFDDITSILNQGLEKPFDLTAYEKTLSDINDLAIIAKQNGGVLTEQEQEQLIDLYTLPNFIKGQDYSDAIDALKDLQDTMFDMTRTANNYELSFSGLSDTTDLRKAQIEEEKAFLINNLPELSSITKDNFVSMYEAIDPSNTELIESYEEYGDLLVEQADLLQETASALNVFDNAISSIRNNAYATNTTASTNELIRQYNSAINNSEFDKASSLATQISSTAFGDTTYLNQDLIKSLEDAKLSLGIEDEILNVNIVSSQLSDTSTTSTTYTPSVYVANQTTTSTSDERLANIEALLVQLLIKNTSMDNTLDGFEINGIKTT